MIPKTSLSFTEQDLTSVYQAYPRDPIRSDPRTMPPTVSHPVKKYLIAINRLKTRDVKIEEIATCVWRLWTLSLSAPSAAGIVDIKDAFANKKTAKKEI